MALTNGTNYDHIDLQAEQGGDTVRHMLQDTKAREDLSALADAVGTVPSGKTVQGQIDENADDVSELKSAKVNKPILSPNGTSGQLLRTNGDGTTAWVDQGTPTDEQVGDAVSAWLAAHPEATTTVEDGSLTDAKFTALTWEKIKNNYITPEIFGAIGDGTADDTDAMQNAVNYAQANKIALFLDKKYLISDEIKVTDAITIFGKSSIKQNDFTVILDGVEKTAFGIEMDNSAQVNYRGEGLVISNINIKGNSTRSGLEDGGTGIALYSRSTSYMRLENLYFSNLANAIEIINDGTYPAKHFGGINMIFDNFNTNGCDHIIAQTNINNPTAPYIYGGRISNMHYEGTHAPNGGYAMDLRGFREYDIVDCVFEGALTSNLDAVMIFDNWCTIHNIYFEMVGSDTYLGNTITLAASTRLELSNVYGPIPKPFLVLNSDANQFNSSLIVKDTNIIGYSQNVYDDNSTGILYIRDCGIQNRTLNSKIKYSGIISGELGQFTLTDDLPIFSVDFEKFVENGNYLGDWCKIIGADAVTTELVTDPMFGSCLKLYNTSGNYLNKCFRINLSNIKMERFVVVMTVKALANVPPVHTGVINTGGIERFTFDYNNFEKDKFITIIMMCKQSNYTQDVFIDWNSSDSQAEKQYYVVGDLSVFAGWNFGACKSKLNISKM